MFKPRKRKKRKSQVESAPIFAKKSTKSIIEEEGVISDPGSTTSCFGKIETL